MPDCWVCNSTCRHVYVKRNHVENYTSTMGCKTWNTNKLRNVPFEIANTCCKRCNDIKLNYEMRCAHRHYWIENTVLKTTRVEDANGTFISCNWWFTGQPGGIVLCHVSAFTPTSWPLIRSFESRQKFIVMNKIPIGVVARVDENGNQLRQTLCSFILFIHCKHFRCGKRKVAENREIIFPKKQTDARSFCLNAQNWNLYPGYPDSFQGQIESTCKCVSSMQSRRRARNSARAFTI